MEFLEYIKQQRSVFVKIAGTYTVTNHLKLRTEIDSLLIAYDQMAERLRVMEESSNESAALPLHVVSGLLPFTEVLELNICIEKLNTKQITLEEFASDVWNTAYRVGYDMASEQ